MKYASTPEELALAYMLSAADAAARDLQAGIKVCGELSGDESKQSKANKEYFADEARVRAEAVRVISAFRREIASRVSK